MRKRMSILVDVLSIAFIISMSSSFIPKNEISIIGEWKMIEVQTIKPDGSRTTIYPTESEIIFAKNYYIFCWTSHVPNAKKWQMADSVKLKRFDQSIVNTGNYSIENSILTTKAKFAMNPMFVNGEAKFKCFYRGDTLILRGLSVFSSGNIPHPVYANGSYIISKLLKIHEK